MARNESKKLPITLFLASLSLHLFVFAASSHEYVWSKPVKKSRPLKFRVVSVEKPKEKLPPNSQSRFLSNSNRKESGSGKPSKTPRLKREDRDLIPSRRGGVGPETASLSPAPESRVPALSVSPTRPPTSPAVVKPKPEPEREEKKREKKFPETSKITETPQPTETASLAPKPEPSVKTPPLAIQDKIQPKAKPTADKKLEREKKAAKAIPKIESKSRPVVEKKAVKKVVKEKPREESQKIEAKGKNSKKLEMAALPPAPKPKPQVRAPKPVRRNPPVDVTPRTQPPKVKKIPVRESPDFPEIKKTIKPIETTSIAPTPEPSDKSQSSATKQEEIQPKVVDKMPEKKRIESKESPRDKDKPNPVVEKKAVKKVVKKKLPKKNKKVDEKKQTKEKVELAALKPVFRPTRPKRPVPKRPQAKDPLALFRVKPKPKGKPNLPQFDLSDEIADRIAKKSLSDEDLEKEKGETISLDTRDFRYASYFAHIKRRIQNAWIWPLEAQKNRGKLLLRFKLKKNGALEEVRLIKSAGVRILDDLAMAAVTKAAPFNPFPEGLERKSITATFVYD